MKEPVKVIDHEYEKDGTGVNTIPAQWDVYFTCGACKETLIDMDEPWYPKIKMTKCPYCRTPIDWDGWNEA